MKNFSPQVQQFPRCIVKIKVIGQVTRLIILNKNKGNQHHKRKENMQIEKKGRKFIKDNKQIQENNHLSSLPTMPLDSTGAANLKTFPDPSRTVCSFK